MGQGSRFEPNEEQRRTVRAMSGYGVPHDDIATMLRVDPKTLRKHFRDELERGSIEATAKVGQSLFRMATEGNSVAAAIFWMKARAGWREKPDPNALDHLPEAADRNRQSIPAPTYILPDDPHEAVRMYQRIIRGEAA